MSPNINDEWNGWERAKETNGSTREWPNDRIVSSYFTEEEYDTQNDRVHLSAFLFDKASDGQTRIEWAMTNGVIGLVHGKTELGFIHIGKPLAYRKEGNKLELKYGVYNGSPTVDWLWENEIKKRGMEAGLSIGGMNLEKDCGIDGKCDVTKLDLWEWSYTPTPANEGAINTALNKFAKSMSLEKSLESEINNIQRGFEMSVDDVTLKGIEDILEKRKVHLAPGQKPPEGAQVQTGPKGGKYYDSGGGGGGAPPAQKPGGEPKKPVDKKPPAKLSRKKYVRDEMKYNLKERGSISNDTWKRLVQDLQDDYNMTEDDAMEMVDDEMKNVLGKSTKSLAKSAILKHLMKNPGKDVNSWTFLKTCEPSQKYANQLDKAGLNFDEISLQFNSIIKTTQDHLINKGWVCECKECSFSHTSNEDCRSYSCPMCGSEMRKMVYPSLMKDEDQKPVLNHYNEGDFPEEVPTDEAPYDIDKNEKGKEANNMPDYENMSDEEKKEYEKQMKMKKASPPASPSKGEKADDMPYEDDKENGKKKKEDEENMTYSKSEVDTLVSELKKTIESQELMIKDIIAKQGDDEEENRVDEGEDEKGSGYPVGDTELSKKALDEAVSLVVKSGKYQIAGVDHGTPDVKPPIRTDIGGPAGVEPLQKSGTNRYKNAFAKVMNRPDMIKGVK